MKAIITDGKGSVSVKDVPEPKPGPYQCLCEIHACATCSGTDQKIVEGKLFPGMQYPGILGHESFGSVIQRGEKVRNINEGARFLRPIAMYHGDMLGGYHCVWGCMVERGLVTDTAALLEDNPGAEIPFYCQYQQEIPPGLSLSAAQATMLVTLKEIAGFIKNTGVRDGSSVVVLGAGSVAMAMCFFAKLKGAFPVIAIGRRDEALAQCLKTGADFTVNNAKEDMAAKVAELTGKKGADFVLDAAGDTALLAKSASALAPGGKIVTYAIRGSGALELNNFAGPAGWSFTFGAPDETGSHQYLIDLVRLGAVNLDMFYSHKLPITRAEEGFRLLRNKEAFKVVFEM